MSPVDVGSDPVPAVVRRFDIQAWRRKIASYALHRLHHGRAADSTAVTPIPRTGIHRILVCRPNHRLGNLLLLTPLLAELQRCYPGAQVDLVVGGARADALFRAFPNVGNVFRLPRHAFRQPLKFLQVQRAVRRERYDLAIDPDIGSLSSRVMVSRCRSTWRIGFSGANSAQALSHAMPIPLLHRHMGQLPVMLLRWAMAGSAETRTPEIPGLDLRLSEHERTWGRQRLAELLGVDADAALPGTVALFTHATGARRHEDVWWQQLLASLRSQFPGHAFLEILPAHGHASLVGMIPAWHSSSPRRVAAIIAATRLFLTVDCGVMHLACAARGPRVVGLFQSADPAIYGPYGSGNCAVSTLDQSAAELGSCVVRSLP